MQRCVNVIGVGMSRFTTCALDQDCARVIADTVDQALADAGLDAGAIQGVFVASAQGDGESVQRALERSGLKRATLDAGPQDEGDGGSLLFRACQAVQGGLAEAVLVLGVQGAPAVANCATSRLGAAAEAYLRRYKARPETFAMIAVKARQHARLNPHAPFRQPLTLEEVLASPSVAEPLTGPQLASPSAGAAAVVLCSDRFVRDHACGQPVRVLAQARVSPGEVRGDPDSPFAVVGYDISVAAARDLYELAGIGPEQVSVCELHDSTTLNELLLYEALGFCREGDAEKLIEDGDNTYGGNVVVNPSGGLLCLGDAPAATGLAQCIELVRHLRGSAGERQVANARIALQQQTAMDGTVIATLYCRD